MAGAIVGATVCVLPAGAVWAQTAHQLQLEVAASHARPPASLVGDPASYLTGTLHWLHSGRFIAFGGIGGGLAVQEEGDGWISAYGGTRLERSLTSALIAGISASATGFRMDRPDEYRVAALRLQPDLRIGAGATQLAVQLEAGLGIARSRLADEEFSDDLWSAGAALHVEHTLGGTRIRAGAGTYETPTGTFVSGGGSVETGVGALRVNLDARVWSVPDATATGAAQLRLELPLTRVLHALAAGGRSDPDPLLGVPAGTYASAGLAWDVLATISPPPPPLIELVAHRGAVRFTVTREAGPIGAGAGAGGITSLEVLGDFSAWQPVPLREVEPGRWSAEVPIAPGVYHFVFRVDGELWVPANAPGRAQDEWGRPTATLVVPDA